MRLVDGMATRQRSRPGRSSLNFDATIAEVEEARMASRGAAASSSEKIRRLSSTRSGPFSCTRSTPSTASAAEPATETRAAARAGSRTIS
jgi:hypothetical protein